MTDWTIGSTTDDLIILKSREGGYTKAFYIEKWTGSWTIDYFKCKHYAKVFKIYYGISKILQYAVTHIFTANGLVPTASVPVNYMVFNQKKAYF